MRQTEDEMELMLGLMVRYNGIAAATMCLNATALRHSAPQAEAWREWAAAVNRDHALLCRQLV